VKRLELIIEGLGALWLSVLTEKFYWRETVMAQSVRWPCYWQDDPRVRVRLTAWVGFTVFPAGFKTVLNPTHSATQWVSWVTALGTKWKMNPTNS
jgi:hypothetical protein